MFLIFGPLNLFELLSVAATNTYLLFVVEDILRRRFLRKSLIFHGPYYSFDNLQQSKFFFQETDDEIIIKHLPTILKSIEYFGHIILSLTIVHRYNSFGNETSEIYRLVNVHCSGTLSQIHISNTNKKSGFDAFKNPFERVENVTLRGHFQKLSNSNYSFDEIFPSMQQLNLDAVEIDDLNWCDKQISHLTHLSIDTRTIDSKQLIRNNPQIRNLALKSVTPELLHFVAIELPLLENFDIAFYNENVMDNYPIFHFNGSFAVHFDHLKRFKVDRSSHSVPANITFGDIEEFVGDGLPRECTRWIEFVKNQETLKKLSIIRNLRNSEIVQLSNATLNLVEMSLECGKETNIEELVQLIESAKQLVRIHLNIPWKSTFFVISDAIRNAFAVEWTITQTKYHIYLQRNKAANQ